MVKIAPYGTWTSPIGVGDVAALGGGPQWAALRDGQAWWAEARPAEGGRLALCRAKPGEPARDVLPAPWNVRNRVHEYGGTPWALLDTPVGTRLVFTHWDDQRWYLHDPDGTDDPMPISPEPVRRHGLRYADATGGPDGTELWCVRETVTGDLPTDIHRDLVAIPLSGVGTDPGEARRLTASHHFLTGPKISPDGRRVAWIGWNHPAMPWDGTELCVADITGHGTLGPHRVVAGGPTEAVCQVEWDGPDTVVALTDPDGWWNLYRIDVTGATAPVNLAPVADELGGPMWRVGSRWFTPLGGDRYAVLRTTRLAVLDAAAGTVTDVAIDLPVWHADLTAAGGALLGIAGGPSSEDAVVWLDMASGRLDEITPQRPDLPDAAYLPAPVARTFTDPRGRTVPAYLYLPANPDFTAPDGTLPPLIVHAHGGPTGSFAPGFAPTIAFFTSRGFAFVAVNYGGSTGYGRQFRERLREQWGVVDVADCAAVAECLTAEGTVDGRRIAIRGGSAGGWTAAASLTSVSTYHCGTVMFPILDPEMWTAEGGQTHDFESRYMDGLIGALPEHADRYAQRSPARHADRLAGPVLMLQGLDDQICPPVQADKFIAGLRGTGIPHAYLTFEGEQHGFRKAESIRAAIAAELSFYGQVFGFTTPGVPTLDLLR
ncbi:MAG TPA: prolyl oligopeptidase family serine peptidase [Pseudonocardiaceae bacterium]|nr:prolyl oligopeptidase family serine peptidase [Pseudonocardiaceae bacterium]